MAYTLEISLRNQTAGKVTVSRKGLLSGLQTLMHVRADSVAYSNFELSSSKLAWLSGKPRRAFLINITQERHERRGSTWCPELPYIWIDCAGEAVQTWEVPPYVIKLAKERIVQKSKKDIFSVKMCVCLQYVHGASFSVLRHGPGTRLKKMPSLEDIGSRIDDIEESGAFMSNAASFTMSAAKYSSDSSIVSKRDSFLGRSHPISTKSSSARRSSLELQIGRLHDMVLCADVDNAGSGSFSKLDIHWINLYDLTNLRDGLCTWSSRTVFDLGKNSGSKASPRSSVDMLTRVQESLVRLQTMVYRTASLNDGPAVPPTFAPDLDRRDLRHEVTRHRQNRQCFPSFGAAVEKIQHRDDILRQIRCIDPAGGKASPFSTAYNSAKDRREEAK